MRKCLWLLPAMLASLAAVADAGSGGGVFDLKIRPLAPDIYVLYRPDPLRQPVEPNALVIVNEADVVVVEPGGVPLSAENAIGLIRGLTSKPVSAVINTHWHGDHVLGNQVYRREFPDVRIIAHANTYRDITGRPLHYIERQDRQFSDFIAQIEALVTRGEATPRQRQLLADVRVAREENRKVKLTPPTLSFTDEVILHRGQREIHIRHLGRGNTEGDAIVWLPRERVLASGDLVVHQIPYGFGSFPKEWIATLDRLAEFDFEVLVPGHGEVQTGREHIRLIQAMLASVRAQAAKSVAAGLDLDATRAAMDLSAWEKQIAGDDPLRKQLFKAWWRDPITRSAWLEAQGQPIVQGAADETG
jgi:glyoxylase-like metal-dependent hydrolase (beta-lactamase superfamily II)